MNITGKPVVFGAPIIVVSVLVAVMALWSWGPIGAHGDGVTSTAGLSWNVEYWHRNSDGLVLGHQKQHNAMTGVGIEEAMLRLIKEGELSGGDADTFDQIVLMNTDDSADDGLLAANILLDVDGTNNADGVESNPADGGFTDVGTTTDGDGKVTVTFLAQGDPQPATQMHLVKAAPNDTADGGGTAVAAADVAATIEISVDLADTDTLQVDWTINLSAE